MQRSIVYWLTAQYRKTDLAQDDSPAQVLQKAMTRLSRHWQRAFDDLADKMGKRVAERVLNYSDKTLKQRLITEKYEVKFTMSQPMRDAYQAVIGEQVGLIKSIASEHLSDVQGLVMRSAARGRDLGSLQKELRQRYGITKRRAQTIARDQNNKATSTLQAARQKHLGITDGIWRHSGGGKEPRPSHLHADGEVFKLDKGLYLDGEWVLPGQAINCRCTWEAVLPGLNDEE